MENEIWVTAPVDNYGRNYEISSIGTLRRKRDMKIITPDFTVGYAQVALYRHGKFIRIKVHRLVALAFIPNPNNLPQINHKNGIKNDNRIENLEWCTQHQNMQHAYCIGLELPRIGADNTLSKAIIIESKLTGEKKKYESIRQAAKAIGINQSDIVKFCKGKKPSTKYECSYV